MNPVLLIDFGSTYTKVTAVDTDAPAILGTASSYTTVETDVGEGLDKALALLQEKTGPLAFAARYACSSAAGGLRMIACGLVPSLTVEAARRAALGAGAKVIRVYSYQLTESDVGEIGALKPDILLLTGGTDGGNSANILQNAQMLAQTDGDFPIIIAGNRVAAPQCVRLLQDSAHETIVSENVMPVFNALNIGPVQDTIRKLFLRRIVRAKGLTHQQSLLNGIMMPTPSAVMRALTLLADGPEGRRGLGDLVAVDLGGATTDVYSIADGLPTGASTILRGLPEPHAKRTVEGDIGMRYSARGVLEAAGLPRLCALSGLSEDAVEALLARIEASPGHPARAGQRPEAAGFCAGDGGHRDGADAPCGHHRTGVYARGHGVPADRQGLDRGRNPADDRRRAGVQRGGRAHCAAGAGRRGGPVLPQAARRARGAGPAVYSGGHGPAVRAVSRSRF